ncbi:MAG: hypothetical protein ACLGSD_02200 [Acidobacteriota bacterium]
MPTESLKWKPRMLAGFSVLLPIVTLAFLLALILTPACLTYLHLRQLAHGNQVVLRGGVFEMRLPLEHLFAFCVRMQCVRLEKLVALLQAPGAFLAPLLGFTWSRSPGHLDFISWRTFLSPIGTLPEWFLLGRGLDAIYLRRRIGRVDLAFSLVLSVVFLTLALGLRFGLSASDRAESADLYWLIDGFAMWAVLIAIPAAAWLNQRRKRTSEASNSAI